ncbi:hypothetical protein [Streptomyces sp. LaPpAH-108]|uniref:hypothetical protein n=1 Tax=Streptomyces sp. LaPpAH-108 TaxID=1155714 RepID=UPI0003682831|nr:hypothetical protein [Streptomyces sp. LaPpAH-108]
MICSRCGALIQGTPLAVCVETGSAVSATIYICPTPCKSEATRQTTSKPGSGQ